MYLNLTPDGVDMDTVNEIASETRVPTTYAYAEYLSALCGLDTAGADRDFFRNYILPAIHQLDATPFEEDPYYRFIRFPEGESGAWSLKMQTLKAGEAFVCNDFTVTEDKRMIPQIGFFDRPFTYPAILENGREWMTLMPNETVTILPDVARARGRVLTYGLGLGYFAYMASQKDVVESVTVVERDENPIRLFREYILPQFPNKDKIRIIQGDALQVAERLEDGEYDFIFADIWHDVGDGTELYLKLKRLEKGKKTRYAYWIEKTIRCYLDKSLWP